MIQRTIPLALIISLTSCADDAPQGNRDAAPAIAAAQRYQSMAKTCFEANDRNATPACQEAAFASMELNYTPTNFATDEDWKNYSEAWGGGNNLMIRTMQRECAKNRAQSSWAEHPFCQGFFHFTDKIHSTDKRPS